MAIHRVSRTGRDSTFAVLSICHFTVLRLSIEEGQRFIIHVYLLLLSLDFSDPQ